MTPARPSGGTQVFGFDVPVELPGVPAKVLSPREAWSDKDSYDATRAKLAGMFKDNFTKFVKVSYSSSAFHLFFFVEILRCLFVRLSRRSLSGGR